MSEARKPVRHWLLTPLAAATLLAGCAVGPDYSRPASALDAGFINAGTERSNAAQPGAEIASFWRGFNDPALDALIERAIAANGDVRIAQARLQEARGLGREADAQALPTIGVQAGATRAVTPEYELPGTSRSQRTSTLYDAGFVANWELDFFGRARRGAEAAAAQVQASEAGLNAALTSVAAEVARNYIELRGLQQAYAVNSDSLVNQRESLALTQARLDAGRGTQLDVERSRSLVASTEAGLPALQAAIDRSIYRLATLTAQPPRALREQLLTPAPLPSLPVTDLATLPIGTPEQWLQRRPDIAVAERQLAAATANIGVAKADLYPRISLTGLLGLAALGAGDLFDSKAGIYSLGAGISWTLLDFGRIRGRIDASDARAQAALANYEQTVATALEETEGAMSQFTRTAQRSERLAVAAEAAEAAARLARLRYDAGVTDFLAVLDADREVLRTRDLYVQSQSATASALVAVYRAIGGGWAAPAVGGVAAAPASTQPR
ncbi:efflux transporter outer membrane subunit [Rivibacter subsaxonicus]|uniref:Multidrug efflux system outer membrane protein n=1 Tax=Rivibacter subsaxonicus TaxID=457575 RepID=A0A4Q7VWR9_9BURK|nr:efflux transporter outer membrane subunit [Rivibacter subsaxonicus]RZU01187.1 multidrug efflux system outer membrane protein [Rivibacter subsaxonicus]